jgi:hypothetical protein
MNLGLTREELRGEVGRFLGYGRDYSSYNDFQKDDVDSWIRRGLRQFYSPPPIPGATKSHEWNFLRPTKTLATVASTASYILPDEVGGLVGDLVFASEQAKPSVEILNYQRFLEAKITNPTRTGRPIYAAALPTAIEDGVSAAVPSSWTLEFWPIPDKVYTLTYRYSEIQQDAFEEGVVSISGTAVTLSSTTKAWPLWAGDAILTTEGYELKVQSRTNDTTLVLCGPGPTVSAKKYLLQSNALPGGAQHAETIVASCLSIAEEYGETPSTRYRELFMQRLMASIAIDGQGYTSENLGQNLDHSDGPSSFNKHRLVDFNVKVNGTLPS